MKKYSILVVEDEALIAASLVNILSSFGYTVHEPVARGKDAIQSVTGEKPDLVLMDIELAGTMNGIETAGKIHAIADIPIVYLTAYTDDQRLEQAQLTEPYGYIVKPAQGREFKAVIEMALYKHALDRKLKESEEFNRNLVENLPDYIVVCDLDGKIHYVNFAAEQVLGMDAGTVVGTSVLSYLPEKYHDQIPEKFRNLPAGGGVTGLEMEILTKDGNGTYVIIKCTPIRYHGSPAILLLLTDITLRKNLEDELKSEAHKLKQISSAFQTANNKLKLLSGITRHDINNQLTILIGFLSVLEREQKDIAHNEYFRKIGAAADRISAMIMFTKNYEEIGVNAPAWGDIRELVETATRGHSGAVRLENDLPPGRELIADPLISKVFFNIVDNAVRYGEKITTIRFYGEEQHGEYLIICEDDGIGIPADQKEKIFERGFGKNTGLGLFLSREIAAITGIKIHETGEPGRGARFEIRVPEGKWHTVPEGQP
jgi:PAS domain S-box-containing protein